MKKNSLLGAFFMSISLFSLPFLANVADAAATKTVSTDKQAATTKPLQTSKNTVKKSTVKKPATKKVSTKKAIKKKKAAKKHKDKINTTIAPLIDPSHPPGGN